MREIHADVISEGGLGGEYENALDGALSAVVSAFYYDQFDDPVAMAAWYGHAIAVGHCFVDGNKRTALIVLDVILIAHDIEIALPQEDMAEIIELVAEGSLDRGDLIEYLAAVVKESAPIQRPAE